MKNPRLLIAIVLLCSADKAETQWINVRGPFSNGNAYAVAMTDSAFFAGTYGDGIFFSSDSGSTWVQADNGLQDMFIECVSIAGPNVLAGSARSGIYLSTNGGKVWTKPTGIGQNVTGCFVLAAYDSIVFAHTNDGLEISTDHGLTWKQPADRLLDYDVDCFAFDDSEVYAGTWNAGIFRSTNNGAFWSETNHPLSFQISALAIYGKKIFAGTYSGISVSVDNGASWKEADSGLTSVEVRCIVPDGPLLFVGTWGGGVYVSADSGTTWKQTNIFANNPKIYSLAADGSIILAGTGYNGGVYRSLDSGKTWTQRNNGSKNLPVLSIAVDGARLLAGTQGGGIYATSNGGEDWSQRINNLQSSSIGVLVVNGNEVYAGSNQGGVSLSTNHGGAWSDFGLRAGTTNIQSLIVRDSTLYAGLNNGLATSSTSSASWSYLVNGLTNFDVRALAASGPYVIAGTWGGGIFRYGDNRSYWVTVNNGLTYLGVSSLAQYGSQMLAGTFDGGVFLSTNQGTEWAQSNGGLGNSNIRSVLVTDSYMFAGTEGGLYVSTSSNLHWSLAGLAADTIYTIALGDTTIYVGTYNGIYHTSLSQLARLFLAIPELLSPRNDSSGISQPLKFVWGPVSDALAYRLQISFDTGFVHLALDTSSIVTPTCIFSMLKSDTAYYWRVCAWDSACTGGWSEVRRFETGTVTIAEQRFAKPTEYALYQNYPNPFNPSTTIQFTVPTDGRATLKVYNPIGQEVATLFNDEAAAGVIHQLQFDGSYLASGIYILRLVFDGKMLVKKMLLLK